MALSTLPDSILHSILSQTLPPRSPLSIPRRYASLLRYTRVCKSLARVAQQLLFLHVDLNTRQAAIEFCAAVDDSPGARRLAFGTTRTLRLAGPDEANGPKQLIVALLAESVLKSTPGVKELVVEGLWIDPLSLSFCADLTHLTLVNSTLLRSAAVRADSRGVAEPAPPSSYSWYLPSLTSLHLHCTDFIRRAKDGDYLLTYHKLLTPQNTPKLVDVALTWHGDNSEPDLTAIAPQLERLWLARIPLPVEDSNPRRTAVPDLPFDVLRALSPERITHLSLDIHDSEDLDALPVVAAGMGQDADDLTMNILLQHAPERAVVTDDTPPRLCTLRLSAPFHLSTLGEKALFTPTAVESLPWLQTLDALLLPDVSRLPAEVVLQHAQQRELTRAECDARGVQLREFAARAGDAYGWEEREVALWRRLCVWGEGVRKFNEEYEEEDAENDGAVVEPASA